MHLWVIVALICGRISTKKVKVALIVHIPNKHTLSLVQDDRNWRVIVGTVLVLSFNELQRDSGFMQGGRLCASNQKHQRCNQQLTLCCRDDDA